MTNRHLIPLVTTTLLALVIVAGCSDDNNPISGSEPVGTDDYATIDFDEPYGGLTKTDEDPAFGDAYLVQDMARESDEEFDDELADDQQVRALERLGEGPHDGDGTQRPRFTFLRLLWGDLDGAVDEESGRVEDGDIVDWTGQLSVDRGIVLIRRVVLFERPYDSIVRPRPDRHTVAWNSHTGGHFDGLVIEIIEPPAVDLEDDEPNLLHLRTGPFTQDFVVADLADLDDVFAVEPAGNAIHLTGFNLSDLNDCPKGFLGGVWRDDPETDDGSGMFRGRWISLLGRTHGHLRGAYGFDADGSRVFFGKYVGRGGQFEGLIAGTWEPSDREGHGSFVGHWVSENETIDGRLGGAFMSVPERPGGFFQGRWAADCDEEAVADIVD